MFILVKEFLPKFCRWWSHFCGVYFVASMDANFSIVPHLYATLIIFIAFLFPLRSSDQYLICLLIGMYILLIQVTYCLIVLFMHILLHFKNIFSNYVNHIKTSEMCFQDIIFNQLYYLCPVLLVVF